jgi:hypothetical protein
VDVLFKFKFDNAPPLWLIVEVKWAAGPSSEDQDGNGTQLAHEWMAVVQQARGNDERDGIWLR